MAYTVLPGLSISTITVTPQATYAKFAGTPMAGAESIFLSLADQYGIDPNWALSYLQFESGFGRNDPSGEGLSYHYNPWDMVIADHPVDDPDGYVSPYNGWTYYRYGSMQAGLEAGFRNWKRYIDRGWSDWQTSLSVALCGHPEGCDSPWVGNVINQGRVNAQQWPVGEGGPPGVVTPGGQPTVIIIPGASILPVVGMALVGAGTFLVVSSRKGAT